MNKATNDYVMKSIDNSLREQREKIEELEKFIKGLQEENHNLNNENFRLKGLKLNSNTPRKARYSRKHR